MSWGHFVFILGQRVILGPFSLSGSLWVLLGLGVALGHFGPISGHFWFFGHCRSILDLGVTLGPFWVCRSLRTDFWSEGHSWSILGVVTLGPFWVWGSLWINFGSGGYFGFILGFGVSLGPFWV